MKKAIAIITAMVFALTLGTAFAEEQTSAPAAPEKKMEEKAPVKTKKSAKKSKKKKKKKKTAAKTEVTAPATPAAQ